MDAGDAQGEASPADAGLNRPVGPVDALQWHEKYPLL